MPKVKHDEGKVLKERPDESAVRDAIRRQMDEIFSHGTPKSFILIAEMDSSVAVSCVGSFVDLRALLVTGAKQVIHMVDKAQAEAEAAMGSNRPPLNG